MALGDNRSSGGYSASKVFDQTYYGRIRLKNNDNLVVGFTYNKGLLKVEISEEKESYKYDPLININISPNGAKSLIKELKQFIERMKNGEDIPPESGVGIRTGIGDPFSFIAFKTTGNRPSIPEHSFIIGKADSSKTIQSAVEFVFNSDDSNTLHWSNVEKMEAKKVSDPFSGIQTFLDVLKEFDMSSAGAIGASVWDTGRYDMNRLMKKIDPIYEKLGIETASQQSGGSSSSGGFYKKGSGYSSSNSGRGFSGQMNPPTGKSNKKSFDEIEDMFD